jgi:hypothetical protein
VEAVGFGSHKNGPPFGAFGDGITAEESKLIVICAPPSSSGLSADMIPSFMAELDIWTI